MPKNESFNSYLKDLQLSKFSDIWTINTTHNKFLAHELKMCFHLLNVPVHAIFNVAKIYMYENVMFILHYKYPNNLYL